MSKKFDLSAYLVIGAENTNRPVEEVVEKAIRAGFTFIQIRSKKSSAREIIMTLEKCANIIATLNKNVALVVNDRLDIALAAREAGIKIDGVHVGQSDIPTEVCRKYLGEEAIIGLSARTENLLEYVKATETCADYFGIAPLHETATKSECKALISLSELAEVAKVSALPVVVGGGVKLVDIPALAKTGVAGFFVVSAVAGAENPYAAAKELVDAWQINE